MQKEILMLSPGPDFTLLAKEICCEIKEKEVEIIEVGCKKEVLDRVLSDSGANRIKVMIMKRYWQRWLPENFFTPVVFMYTSAFDLLFEIFKIKKSTGCQKIAYLEYEEEIRQCNFAAFEEILGKIDLEVFTFESSDQIEGQMRKAIASKPEIIVTTAACLAKRIERAGVPARVVYPNKESIMVSIHRAREIIAARERESNRVYEL